MKQHNYSSKGLNIKKTNNKIMMSEHNFQKQKEFFLKLPYFKILNVLDDMIIDKEMANKYTKEYLIMSKQKNNIEELISAEEYSDIQIHMFFVEMLKAELNKRLNK